MSRMEVLWNPRSRNSRVATSMISPRRCATRSWSLIVVGIFLAIGYLSNISTIRVSARFWYVAVAPPREAHVALRVHRILEFGQTVCAEPGEIIAMRGHACHPPFKI